MRINKSMRWRAVLIISLIFLVCAGSLMLSHYTNCGPRIEHMVELATEAQMRLISEWVVLFKHEQPESYAMGDYREFWVEFGRWVTAAAETNIEIERGLKTVLFTEESVPLDRFGNELRLREVEGKLLLESSGTNGVWNDGDDLRLSVF